MTCTANSRRIEDYCKSFAAKNGHEVFEIYDNLSPVVDTKSCFDDLLVEKDHISRKPSDTYYLSDTHLLRTHTSAHQSQFIREGISAFLCCGDVYRRDEIDASHYPVFHQVSFDRDQAIIDFVFGFILFQFNCSYIQHLRWKECESTKKKISTEQNL